MCAHLPWGLVGEVLGVEPRAVGSSALPCVQHHHLELPLPGLTYCSGASPVSGH